MSIGKMVKHEQMLQLPVLRRHLPETYWMTPYTTARMLRAYPVVFIKPNHGSGGNGIIMAKRLSNGYLLRCGHRFKIVGMNSVYNAIRSFRKKSERYIVQRGLRLAKYRGTIFDIRVYMQKPESEWVIAGMAARVAAKNRFVTNYHKGGHGENLHTVISTLFHHDKNMVDDRIDKIKNLSYLIAETLNKRHELHELGIDICLEKNGRIWIIEANSRPGHKLFAQLPSKSMLRTILRNKQLIMERMSQEVKENDNEKDNEAETTDQLGESEFSYGSP